MEEKRESTAKLVALIKRHTEAGLAEWVNKGFEFGVAYCYVRGETIVVVWDREHADSTILLEVDSIQFILEPGTPDYATIRQYVCRATTNYEKITSNYLESIKHLLQKLE